MENERDILQTQALVVTAGPFKGRICENDDDAFVFQSELSASERAWFKHCGAEWRKIEPDTDDAEEDDAEEVLEDVLGIDCEIVTFGQYLQSRGHYYIPRQFLRPANMKDLVSRLQQISELVSQFALIKKGLRNYKEAFDTLVEYSYIVDEVWHREHMAKEKDIQGRKIFLCHASPDKYFVRQVRNDLANAGHATWMDEFEIQVGDSIVDKINAATESADALVLFLSNAANESAWVKKEWQSVLARYLRSGSPRIYPVRIEDCDVPSIISDIRYADFSESYNEGLEALLKSLRLAERERAKEQGC